MRPALRFTSVSGAAIIFSANTDKKTKKAKKDDKAPVADKKQPEKK